MQTKHDKSRVYCCSSEGSHKQQLQYFPHPKPRVSSETQVTNRVPLQEGFKLGIRVATPQSFLGAQYVPSLARLSPRLKLEVHSKTHIQL